METQVAELEREMNATPDPAAQSAPPKPVAAQPNNKLRGLIVAGALVLAAVALGFYLYSRNRVSTDDAQVDGHIVPMAAKISGTVAEVLVHDNEPVKAGQVLVRIDPRDYQAKLDQSRAQLEAAQGNSKAADAGVPMTNETTLSSTSDAQSELTAAQANYDRAKVGLDQASTSDLAYAQAQVEKAKADNDKAQADLERMKPLAAKAEISQQELDTYSAAARVASSELQSAQQKLTGAEQSVDMARAQMRAVEAQVQGAQAMVRQAQANRRQVAIRSGDALAATASIAQARANLEAAELDLSYTTITAPADGVVTRKSVEVGEIIQPGQELFVLVPLNDVWVTANFKETQLADVHAGQRAEIHVDMYGKTFNGHVDSISGATGSRLSLLPPENATGNFVKVVQRIPVKILLDSVSDQAVLRPGMNVDATIITK
jgi:membrane fusion protein (multidrug efflux system)